MMTTDEIIEMAKESNLLGVIDCFHYTGRQTWVEEATAFAKLVASAAIAKERELLNTVFWAFQEWKEDHMSDSTFIDTVKYLREKSQHE